MPRLGGFLLPSDLALVVAVDDRGRAGLVIDEVKTHRRNDQRTISEQRPRYGMALPVFRQEA